MLQRTLIAILFKPSRLLEGKMGRRGDSWTINTRSIPSLLFFSYLFCIRDPQRLEADRMLKNSRAAQGSGSSSPIRSAAQKAQIPRVSTIVILFIWKIIPYISTE